MTLYEIEGKYKEEEEKKEIDREITQFIIIGCASIPFFKK
jgi:hypothetical protein